MTGRSRAVAAQFTRIHSNSQVAKCSGAVIIRFVKCRWGDEYEEYQQLLARAFNGAITVDGQRIVAHPSGTLIARGSEHRIVPTVLRAPDADNDWSKV